FKNSLFDGSFVSADPNANLAFSGKIDLKKKIPQINAEVNLYNLDLFACNLYKGDSISVLSGKVDVDLKGQSIDDFNGTLQADHIKYVKSNGVIKLDNTDLTLTQDEKQNSLAMISSVADIDVNGKFRSQTLQKSIGDFLHDYFPTFFTAENKSKKQKPNTDYLTFKIRIKDFSPVATLINKPLAISPNTIIQGSFDAQKNSLVVSGLSDKIEYNKTPVRDWFLSVNTANKQVKVNTGFRRVDISDSVYIGNFNFETTSTDNRSSFQVLWDNQSKRKNKGEIDGKLIFTGTSFDLNLGKFFVFTEDSLWQMTGNDHFVIDSSGVINFHDLVFVNGNQRVKLEGLISKNPKDQFIIELNNFKLSQLNPLLKRNGVNLQGALTGTTSMSDLYNKVVFSSTLTFNKLTINNTLIGTGELNSFFDKGKDLVSINGFFKRDFGKISESAYNDISFDGYYYPSQKDSALDLNLHLNQFGLVTLQPFVKDIFTFDKGVINGNANIKGSLSKPILHGELELADVKNFKVDYLNVPYDIRSGKIKIEPGEITLDFIPVYDMFGNKAVVYGNIFHDNFTNMKLDFDINTKDFMALNTTSLQNSSYYGKAFCTGNIGLYGPPDALTFEINAKTSKGTQFFIPLAGPEEVSDNGFIRFVKIDSVNKKSHGTKNDFSGLTLKFNLEATPDAEVQILFDAKAGDVIKARGAGNITMNISTLGGFEMFGTYTIVDGSYLFTLENVINKKFDIDNGSTIRWSGDPLNADINIAATYKQRTSLAEFFPQVQSTDQSSGSSSNAAASGVDNNKRYPVDCKLYMRDKLLNPDISFGIELPTVSEVIRSQVMSYINNEQELNRQVFSLLLLRTFVTPLQLQQQSGVSAGGAVGNNASELLSNQLNSWLSNFTKAFNLGVNYRPGGSTSNEELDVAVSTQLLNDKLTIDGNVGVNNNNQTKTSTLIGDLNVNYKLTQDGKIQLKAFNRS
ncbi:MAG TPA: translocation/assembly module TamB domain-containing protein, partial [Bacteroidia bacterium]|nr:translocation/assembly module TamB domain-containing protein [Bacteroidia bacterium]